MNGYSTRKSIRSSLPLILAFISLGCSTQTANDDLIEQAERIVREGESGDLRRVANHADRVLRNDPHHRRALFLSAWGRSIQADAAFKTTGASGAAPVVLDAAVAFRRLRDEVTAVRLEPAERQLMGFAFYNAACIHALNRHYSKAISALDEGYEVALSGPGLSWKELSAQAGADPDLLGLRPLPEYAAFQSKLRRRVLANVRDETPADRPEIERRDVVSSQSVSLRNFRGQEVALIFWGTWCPSSLRLWRTVADLARDPSNGHLAVIGIECEFAPADQVERFSREARRSQPSLLPNVLADTTLLDALPTVTTFPTILFLDREGVVRLRLTGLPDQETITEAIRLVAASPAESHPTGTSR
jgi:thiol-disulfide isomerase/thioredoxin